MDVVEETNERSILDVVTRIFQSFSREPRQFAINTPYVNGSIEGTEYQVRVFADRADFTVFEGTVVVANAMASAVEEITSAARRAGNEDSLYVAKGGFLQMNGNYSAGILEGVDHFHPELTQLYLAQEQK